MSSDDNIEAKLAALQLFPPEKRDAAREMLGLSVEGLPVSACYPLIKASEHPGSLTYPDGWPHSATAAEIWSYLQGDRLADDDPWNGEMLAEKVKVSMHLLARNSNGSTSQSIIPEPDVRFQRFWGHDVRRDRLPVVRASTLSGNLIPQTSRTGNTTNRCVIVVDWLYPRSINADQVWATIRQHDVALAEIVRELAKIVAIHAFFRNSIAGAKKKKQAVSIAQAPPLTLEHISSGKYSRAGDLN